MGDLVKASNFVADLCGDKKYFAESCKDWFPPIARTLYPDKPAAALCYLTGCPERTAYSWVCGQSAVSGWAVRQLLRSEHGAQWEMALMDGASPPWWRERIQAEKVYLKLRPMLRDDN